MASSDRPSASRILFRVSGWYFYATLLVFGCTIVLVARMLSAAPFCLVAGSFEGCLIYNAAVVGIVGGGLGGFLLALGCVILEGRSKVVRVDRHPPHVRTRAVAALAALAIALLLSSVLLGFLPPIQRVERLRDTDLPVVWKTNTSVERTATLQAHAGEVLLGTFVLVWTENATGRVVGTGGTSAFILPGRTSFSFPESAPLEGYVVPRDGVYTIFLIGDACVDVYPCSGGYTAIAWVNLTATNPNLVPTAQLVAIGVGLSGVVGSLGLTVSRRKESRGA